MKYYFPSIITSLNFSSEKLPESFYSVNSGKNAIRLLLRSFNLKPQSKVVLPFYVCDSLKQAVIKEGLAPLYLDLKQNDTFWSDYNIELLLKEKPSAVILVHLYGFLYPDTFSVMEFCRENNIFLIHDTAQSFGIDESILTYSSGIVYSFGPGKSSTAAGGALVKGLDKEFYETNCEKTSNFSFQKLKAELFLKSRIYGYRFSILDRLLQKIIYRLKENASIKSMAGFQLAAAATSVNLVKKKNTERIERYKILEEAVKANILLTMPFEDVKGLYFKIVLRVKKDVLKFRTHLKENGVPFFSLFDELNIDRNKQNKYPVFLKNASSFIELSTESSIPLEEIKRVAKIIEQYI